ncbi:hydroxymethylglutaryl-CoA lyase [Natronospirillum operosum]|uniref:hydroxymethylglutaryl-CoA lyase n=1 Tax=Natronospirillum operosum TaxID=2759953 RepID=A0A4Z0W9Q1_9GAMM|nr:hydroxymethylglutaryl-CoA lyase [Natronospirillum operosum]TGG91152.1 hydroxymethylglutaryl-CoA lyase [Natronospirillum operosum]
MRLPRQVRLVEMGPRDGLQNETHPLAVVDKVRLIERLADTGLKHIESGSFVSPEWVPQMADSADVLRQINRRPGVIYSALTPNMRGFEDAVAAGADEVAVFAAASETFSRRNINCSIQESLDRFRPVLEAARKQKIRVRGYVSTVVGCPYEGRVPPDAVARVAAALHEMGCYEISLGDTLGVGTPLSVKGMLHAVSEKVPVEALAVHFHDTYGQAIANIYAALEEGVSVIDSSVAGLGGCPYAPGAAGNVATEDVLYLLQGLGIRTDVDLKAMAKVGTAICERLERHNRSKVGLALQAREHHSKS